VIRTLRKEWPLAAAGPSTAAAVVRKYSLFEATTISEGCSRRRILATCSSAGRTHHQSAQEQVAIGKQAFHRTGADGEIESPT
jgi:hypothetical protein